MKTAHAFLLAGALVVASALSVAAADAGAPPPRSVDLSFYGVSLSQAVQVLVKATHLPVVIHLEGEDIGARTIGFVRVRSKTPAEALRIICEAAGVTFKLEDGVYHLRPGTATPRQTLVKIKLHYFHPDQIMSYLGARSRVPAGIEGILAYPLDNSLLVKGTPEGLAALRRLLTSLDKPGAKLPPLPPRINLTLTNVTLEAAIKQTLQGADGAVVFLKGTPNPRQRRIASVKIVNETLDETIRQLCRAAGVPVRRTDGAYEIGTPPQR